MSYDKSKPSEYDALFQKAADNHGVSYDLLRKLSFNESSFNPKAKSPTGPLGLMQFTKATAKSMGLRVTGGDDDDRYNPELAIDAGARHLASLVTKYNGDELKAALAYNQGEGPKGRKQLEAYDKGDFASISEEGRNYMRKLADVSKSPMRGQLEAFGGITPKGQGIPSDVAFSGIEKSGKVGAELPTSTGFTIEGKEQEAPAKPFAKDFWEHHGETVEEFESRSTFFGFGKATETEFHNSTLGVAFRAARTDSGFDAVKDVFTPTKWNSYQPTAEDIQKLRDSGLPPSYYHVVTGGDAETWDDLITLAKQNYEADLRAADAGTGAHITAGILGSAADPLSYVPLATPAKGAKILNKALTVGAQSAALNVASEGLRTGVAGGDADYTNAMIGGLAFGTGMSALTDVASKALRKTKGVDGHDEFLSPSIRLEARESSINAGTPDSTLMPVGERVKIDSEFNGVPYAEHPSEPGAAVLANGAILSEYNPLNPKALKEFAEVDPERAARGVRLGGFSEIGLVTLRSENTAVRSLASDLVRSPTGMESGTHGKFGATSSDIHERLQSTDNRTYRDMYKAVRGAVQDPSYSLKGITKEQAQQEVFRKAALAIERPELQGTLTKGEREVMDILKQHFDAKRELMENPSVFGNAKAQSIFPGSRHKGTYVPHVYDRTAKALMVQRFGAEGLQEAIARSWLVSYNSRPEVKARVDEHLMELNGLQSVEQVTPEIVQKHAMDKAYGISHSDEFTASAIEENITGLQGIENNSFLEARNMFDSDMPVTLPDGTTFSVNDLRDYDMTRIMPAYDRRVNGDISIMGGTGKTTKELKEEIQKLMDAGKTDGKLKDEANALGDIVKILTGRARRNQDTPLETAARALSDLAFFSKNFYMGPQNYTEVAGMITNGTIKAMLNGIPTFARLADAKRPLSSTEIKELHGALFGRELDTLIRPKREDIIQRMRDNSSLPAGVLNTIGTVKYGTQELAARSPWTWALNQTGNHILDTARQGLMLDVAADALGGKASRFGKENFLKSASITKEQWAGIKQLFVDHVERNEDGKFTIKDKRAMANDPRAMDLWRLADKVADETMLRPHKVSLQDAKAHNALTRMALQFKNFTIRSINSRAIRGFNEATKNSRAIDQAATWAVSAGLAGTFYMMSAWSKSLGLAEEKREAYLERALSGPMVGLAMVTRSSHLGAAVSPFAMVSSWVGYDAYNMMRTSITPKEEQARPDRPVTGRKEASEIMGIIGEQIPAVGYLGSLKAAGTNLAGYLNAPTGYDETEFATSLMESTRELLPNDPVTQQLILRFYEAQGIRVKEAPRRQ